jgi:hypothetical protein
MATTQDTETDARAAFKSASERIRRDMGETKFLQSVARLIIDYIGATRGVDQLANLKTLTSVRLRDDSNLTNINASIRDAGGSVLTDYLEKNHPDFEVRPTEAAVREWSQDDRVCKLLREALALNGDEGEVEKVRRAIKRIEGN